MRKVFAVSVLMLLATGCAYTIYAPGERLVYTLPADEGWQIGSTQPMQPPSVRLIVRRSEHVTEWTEIVRLETQFRMFRLGGMETAQDVYKQFIALSERQCPGSTRWQVIEETPGRVLYEWWTKPCLGFPEHHEVSLLVDGVRDRFRLAYTVKVPKMDTATRERWLDVLRAAKVEAQPK